MKKNIFRQLRSALLPRPCLCCGNRLLGSEQHVCASCLMSLPRPLFHGDIRNNEFVERFWFKPSAEAGVVVFNYLPHDDMTLLIQKMKYGRCPDICRFMGQIMATDPLVSKLLQDADVLIPIPLTPSRKRQRGYNQSELLCEGISTVTGKPIDTKALLRTHFVRSQTELLYRERMKNISGAFSLGDTSAIEGRHVVLVDDVVTTGATMSECINTLSHVPGLRYSILALGWTAGRWKQFV